jgi:predicted nucleic acid-binding protein
VLVALEGKTILVPAVWSLEIANAVLTGERKKRIKPSDIARFLTLLENLPLVEDRQPVTALIADVLPVSRKHALSAYDAAYLALALRHRAPLATLDARLVAAARQTGTPIFPAPRA